MTSPAMSDLAALADELERRVFEMGRSPRPENDAISLGFYIAGQVQALLSALRASRPEPAAPADEDDYEPFDPGNPKLKRCPFCGGEAGLFEIDDMTDANCGGHYVACKTCEASTNLRFSAGDDARPLVCEQWNSRHQRSAPETEPATDAAYAERNQLAALLARLYPSGTKRTAIEGWDPWWHGCVYIDLPTGQASWHYHDREAHLFADLPPYAGEWDGHTTEEKYRRVAALRPAEPAADAVEGAVAEIGAVLTSGLCSDCPPVGYPTDETRCLPCPRRSAALAAAQSPTNTAGD